MTTNTALQSVAQGIATRIMSGAVEHAIADGKSLSMNHVMEIYSVWKLEHDDEMQIAVAQVLLNLGYGVDGRAHP